MADHIQILAKAFPTLTASEINDINFMYPTLEEKQQACANLAVNKVIQEEHISQAPAEASMDYHETIQDILTEILRSDCGTSYNQAISVIKTILENIKRDPNNDKYKRIRLNNPKFHSSLGQYETGVVLLEILGFRKEIDGEEVLLMQEYNEEYIKYALGIISRINPAPPQPPVSQNRNEFLAKIHEDRAKQPFTYVRPNRNLNMPNDTTLQLQEYRRQKKGAYFHERPARVMTLADLNRQAPSAPYHNSPQPHYDSLSSFDNPRNIAIRAFQLSNEFRKSQGLCELVWDEGLMEIGKVHSTNMGDGRVAFGHDGFNARFRQFPIPYVRSGAENVAMSHGMGDPAKVAVDGWINSPGHRKNLLGHFNYMGIGVYQNQKGAWYFTQLFAGI
ncbi:unnamed protein product [Blepharisma stoltei]|uniref:SCP domain-containing protein n=1 Tax=Blepharisma stoltei TaxID=1481888 RepID=A0AAU9JGP7_9CILI|nr:unnamed protein product [Blepharisma stoltei]